MKYILLTLITTITLNCNVNKVKQVKTYYKGFKTNDYNLVENVISDSLTITGGDYIMPYTATSYQEHFKWYVAFLPKFKSLKIETQGNHVLAKTSVESLKFKFLKHQPFNCGFKFYFTSNNKISKIETLDCSNADWDVWEKQVDTLVKWIKTNHPELDGFIHDLTKKGAQNYIKAIELYEKAHAKNHLNK